MFFSTARADVKRINTVRFNSVNYFPCCTDDGALELQVKEGTVLCKVVHKLRKMNASMAGHVCLSVRPHVSLSKLFGRYTRR
jgi:hypothetical protein